MSTSAHGAIGALSMGPSAGYTSLIRCVQLIRIIAMISMLVMYVFATVDSSNISHVQIFLVTNLLSFCGLN
jgi:hypothetical protein